VISDAPSMDHTTVQEQAGSWPALDMTARVLGLAGSACALTQVGNLAATLHLHLEHELGLTPTESGGKVVNMAIGGVAIYGFAFLGRSMMTKHGMSQYLQNVVQLLCAMLMWHVASKADKDLMGMELPAGSSKLDADGLKTLSSLTYRMAGFLLASPSLKTVVISDVADIHTFMHYFAIQGCAEEFGKFSQTWIQPYVQREYVECAGGGSFNATMVTCDEVGKAASLIAAWVESLLSIIMLLTIGTQLLKWIAARPTTHTAPEAEASLKEPLLA